MKEGEQKMVHPELYLNLNYNQKIIFSITIIAIVITIQILVRLKNKASKKCNRQIICQRPKKTFSARNFISNYDEFIKENTKGMTLYEVKDFIKNVDLEIYRLVMKGVR